MLLNSKIVLFLLATSELVFGEQSPNTTIKGDLIIVSRSQWNAKPEKVGVQKLMLPVKSVVIAHSVTPTCHHKSDCDTIVQDIQKFHMNTRQWSDIGYNFLIGGDGLVYEGRGWAKEGAHTKGHNNDSLGIAFIGTFVDIGPTRNEMLAFHLLLDEAVNQKVLVSDYKLYGARQLYRKTESPGNGLYNIIIQLPHWSKYT